MKVDRKSLCKYALDRVETQSLLARIAMSANQLDTRLTALERLTDQDALGRLAMEDRKKEVRLAAIKKVTDQGILEKIYEAGSSWQEGQK